MDMHQRTSTLFDKYLKGDCSPAEWEELLVLVSGIEENDSDALSEPLLRLWKDVRDRQPSSTASLVDRDKMYAAIIRDNEEQQDAGRPAPVAGTFFRSRTGWRTAAAAAVAGVILLAGVVYLRRDTGHPMVAPRVAISTDKVKPGINKAMLILGNGQTIVLDSSAKGAISRQGNTLVINFNGKLAYETGSDGKTTAAEIAYNTVVTGKANQYQLTLPDGSSVWLNAVSSIRFPTAFTGKDRTVEITGEAYFEVKKNFLQPFHVKTPGMDIEVLGTHFNVNAYRDEAIVKTSLLEGSVKISNGSTTGLLVPGQEANLTPNGELKIAEGNVEMAAAWKNGYFQFDQAPLQLIMRQIGRWYDLEIRYAGPIPDRVFKGKLQRSLPLSSILHLLQKGDVHFKTEGRTLTVTQ